jgi:hypothetical protein
MKDAKNQDVAVSPPWWRVPMVWVVLSGPIAVVLASFASAVIAWRSIDPVIGQAPTGQALRAADDMASTNDPKDPLAPALKARNFAAVPRR